MVRSFRVLVPIALLLSAFAGLAANLGGGLDEARCGIVDIDYIYDYSDYYYHSGYSTTSTDLVVRITTTPGYQPLDNLTVKWLYYDANDQQVIIDEREATFLDELGDGTLLWEVSLSNQTSANALWTDIRTQGLCTDGADVYWTAPDSWSIWIGN